MYGIPISRFLDFKELCGALEGLMGVEKFDHVIVDSLVPQGELADLREVFLQNAFVNVYN